ncbi:winged helix-turn-helix transcriptional regulator [Glycocaulis sp.]|uniref:winged helix-turn-helix transcriptional regulator n=1 Tax=Glycocaulis sp. TaxID=1969725 RepID=UPI003D221220
MDSRLKQMIQNNPVSHAMDVVGEAWTMLILREAFRGARRFDDWMERLAIARSVLARRLKTLTDAGLLERRPYQQRPERFEYVLTAMGRDLYGVAIMLIFWEQDWSPRSDPARAIRLVARDGSGPIDPIMAGEDLKAPILPGDVLPRPGPVPGKAPALKEMRRRKVQPAMRASGKPIELGIELFGDYWTNLVLAACFYRVRRYDDFLKTLGVSTSVLADRLEGLVSHGILTRKRYHTRPERFEYVLTERGRALYPTVLAFFAWGARWLCEPGKLPVELVSQATGQTVLPVLRNAVTGEEIDPRSVRPVPAHSASQRAAMSAAQ